PSRSMRSSGTELLTVPKARTKRHGEAAFSFYAPSLWSTLPEDLRMAETVETFKRARLASRLSFSVIFYICPQWCVVGLMYMRVCALSYGCTYMIWSSHPSGKSVSYKCL